MLYHLSAMSAGRHRILGRGLRRDAVQCSSVHAKDAGRHRILGRGLRRSANEQDVRLGEGRKAPNPRKGIETNATVQVRWIKQGRAGRHRILGRGLRPTITDFLSQPCQPGRKAPNPRKGIETHERNLVGYIAPQLVEPEGTESSEGD